VAERALPTATSVALSRLSHPPFDDLDNNNVLCSGALHHVDIGQIDDYNIYAPICVDAANGAYYPTGYVRKRFIFSHYN
jgi:hypothetical protein